MMSMTVFHVGHVYMRGLNHHVSDSYTCKRRWQDLLGKGQNSLPEGGGASPFTGISDTLLPEDGEWTGAETPPSPLGVSGRAKASLPSDLMSRSTDRHSPCQVKRLECF